MDKYTKFEDFMQSVVYKADHCCQSRYGKSLSDAYNVSSVITKMVKALLEYGWLVFVAVVSLLALGPFAFGAACVAFAANPVGMVAIGALAVFGGVAAIRTLYKNYYCPLNHNSPIATP